MSILAKARAPFALALAPVAAVGLAIRVGWTLTHSLAGSGLIVDQYWYHRVANFVADGLGYIGPAAFDQGYRLPTADKPPLYPLLLAAESKLGSSGVPAHRLVGALLGAATIVALALLARRLAGPRAGLLTGLLVALDPQLWVLDSQMLSETLYGLLFAAVLLAAYRVRERPSLAAGAALGLAVGLAALTRPEALVSGILIALLVLATHRRRALAAVALAAAVCALAIGPWIARNWVAFGQPVLISEQSGENIAGANCDLTYHGANLGTWRYECIRPVLPVRENEAKRVAAVRHTGLDYARRHLGRLPVVMLARVGITWGVFHVAGSLELYVAWVLLLLAAAGILVARRRRIPVAILLLPAIAVTVTTAVQFGVLRYRYDADLAFLVLGGIGLSAALPDSGHGPRPARRDPRPAR